MKAEPAAGVWGSRIARFSEPAAAHPGWLLSQQHTQFYRAMSQPPFAPERSHERRRFRDQARTYP